MNQLEQLKKFTTVVADTSDFESMKEFSPTDATTNPSLILAASQKETYLPLIEEAISFAKAQNLSEKEMVRAALDKVFVNFGLEILKIIPGRVSIEIDARLSFDTKESIQRAKQIIALFNKAKIDKKRILIKLAATWEGIKAAAQLEKEGISCNMTLIFSLIQAISSAKARATLISPFVGRILDWHKKQENREFLPHEDPGVISVTQIYNYYKKFGYPTQVMGASFRNAKEILELAGCDLLTISPPLLKELKNSDTPVACKLDITEAKNAPLEKIELYPSWLKNQLVDGAKTSEFEDRKLVDIDLISTNLRSSNCEDFRASLQDDFSANLGINESFFRYILNQDAMASEKLSEGIRFFVRDMLKLEEMISKRLWKNSISSS